MRWWLTECRIGSEGTAAIWLDTLGIETFVPRMVTAERPRGAPAPIIRRRALMPGYVLATALPDLLPGGGRDAAKRRRFRWRPSLVAGLPARVRAADVEQLREREAAGEFNFVDTRPPPELAPGDIVRAIAMHDRKMRVESVDDDGFVTLDALIFGRKLRAHASALAKIG